MDMNKILLVGAGNMAKEYAKVLMDRGVDFITVGRSVKNCEDFKDCVGREAISGGIRSFLQRRDDSIKTAIVCVSAEELACTTLDLIEYGFQNILVEKPGGLNESEIGRLDEAAKEYGADVFIAYNRRFYASVQKAREMIRQDGGVTSFHFEFTEWSHVISGLNKSQQVKDAWLLANSSHVIDMAFFLGGRPKDFHSYCQGKTDWGNCSAAYAGAGLSHTGALFSYCANWEAPGRWSVEVLTALHRLIFRPLEKLQIQQKGSIEIKTVDLADDLDVRYKPGLYRQVEAFLNADWGSLLSIGDQYLNLKVYDKIKNGETSF